MKLRHRWKLGTAVVVSLGLVAGGVAHMATAGTGTTGVAELLPPTGGSVPLSAAEAAAYAPSVVGGVTRPGGSTTATEVAPGVTARPKSATALAAAVAAAPTAAKVTIKGVYQSTNYYCVPASSSITLGTYGVTVSQATLAKEMGTTTAGTYSRTSLPVVNKYVNPLGYSVWNAETTGNATNLLNWAAYDIGTLKRAPTIGVWMEKLPWNKGMSGHFGHQILIYGYDLTKKTLTVWDPWKPTGGTHTLTAAALNATMQSYGLAYVAGHSDADLTAAGDLSGDGLTDMIAVHRPSGALYRYTNTGHGSFQGGSNAVKLGTGWNAMTELAGVGDLTGDGKADVAAVEKSTGKLWLYRGPALAASTRLLIGTGGWNGMRDLIGAGNITGDSKPDLVTIEKSTGRLWVYPGKLNGLAARKQLGTSWTKMTKLAPIGDLSRDGKPDFVAVDSGTGKLWLYKGLTFAGGTSRVEIGTGGWNGMRSLTGVSDLTGDKIPDLITVANTGGDMYLYPGKASGLGTRVKQGSGWNG
ncbi:FG-GAP repeat protein [Kribbella flavida DSM 17836]|uniref:FG-GAP repeat protein n=1 Tax=Kribbella flavida (strain DSM 17836 / JCM 10339 / NBRC 14399) TaxID=479435 RepID=D2PL38_KRIFD|nr:FG-GAP-like repeat-containing protein [Kribbella flavida]ADB34293.1 FG-GAP repeat protein [Kribbella flavida DSM 17836]